MADLSKIRLNNTNYNLKDKQARDFLKGSFLLNSHFDLVELSSIDPEEYGAYIFTDYIALVHYETYSDRNTWTYFYSSDDHNWSFRSLDGQFLVFYPPNNAWYYFENWDENLQLDPTDGISQFDNDFPEIQIGYRIPESVIGFSIHQITGDNYSSELTFSEIDELFNLNCKIIAARTDSYSYPPRNTTFYYVNTTRYRPNEGISFHEFKTFPSNIGTIWYLKIYDLDPDNPEHDELSEVTITELDLHEPEDDEDIDDMLESLDLTVIDDDNLVGSAEIGSGNVVDWSTPKQTKGGVYIVPMTIEEQPRPGGGSATITIGTLGATWQDIFDNLINNGKQIFFFNENENTYGSLIAIGRDVSNNYYYITAGNASYDFITASPGDYPEYIMT